MLIKRAPAVLAIAALICAGLLGTPESAGAVGNDDERGGITDFWSANSNGTTQIGGTQVKQGAGGSSTHHTDSGGGGAPCFLSRLM